MTYYQHHVFCCVNLRDHNSSRPSCAAQGSESLKEYMKKRCKDLNIPETRINASLCLDRCELGPVMVIYPEGIWYHYETKEDIDSIIEAHLLPNSTGRVVSKLLLKDDQKRLQP